MDIESLRNYCLGLPGCTEGLPFGEETLVFKVKGKMFALISLFKPNTVNLKCEPEYAQTLRAQYPEVIIPGYHMNKKHWNTVSLIDGLPASFIRQLIDHSYERVVSGLSKKDQAALKEQS